MAFWYNRYHHTLSAYSDYLKKLVPKNTPLEVGPPGRTTWGSFPTAPKNMKKTFYRQT
jgi:hypothetical protein